MNLWNTLCLTGQPSGHFAVFCSSSQPADYIVRQKLKRWAVYACFSARFFHTFFRGKPVG